MNLKALLMVLAYYGIIIIAISLNIGGIATSNTGKVSITGDYNNSFNTTGFSSAEGDKGGLFGTGVEFKRAFAIATIGLGIDDNFPEWFKTGFAVFQTLILLFWIIFIILDAIWSG